MDNYNVSKIEKGIEEIKTAITKVIKENSLNNKQIKLLVYSALRELSITK